MKDVLSIAILTTSFLFASATTMYDGDYVLTDVYDANKVSVALPADQEFRLQLVAVGESDAGQEYDVSVKIGNSMRAIMSVNTANDADGGADVVKFGSILATRMMPPRELVKVENAITTVLPEASAIILEDGVLRLEGAKGGVVLRAV